MAEVTQAAGSGVRHLRVTVWIVGILVVLGVVAVLFSRWFLGSAAGQGFLARYPGSTPLRGWAPQGLPVWLEWQHALNVFFLVLVVRTGWMVRTHRKPLAAWQPRRGGRRITIEHHTHLIIDGLWLLNGVVFVVLILVTGQWVRIVPTSWGVFPNAASALLQYFSLDWPTENGWVNYNSLQLLSYFVVVFVVAPVAALTGWRLSQLWPKVATRVFSVPLARAIHFPVMLVFVVFVCVHVGLVLTTGPLRNLNHMYGGQDAVNWWGLAVFALSFCVCVAGWFAIRPTVMEALGTLTGRVTRLPR